MLTDSNVLLVNQTLHGYSDGHRLLSGSLELPKELERVMLTMSDMSGPSMVHGFENYITGYPIPQMGMYVIAKTWYASEMTRPGCVWTHSILINSEDFAFVKDLRIFLNLFDRPSATDSFAIYKNRLGVPVTSFVNVSSNDKSYFESVVFSVLRALYVEPKYPVYIPSRNAKEYENLIFLIWNQQWPRLRASFTFCTGSITDRKIDAKTFDIQVVPSPSVSQIKRGGHGATILDESSLTTDVLYLPDWIKTAAYDLMQGSKGDYRSFLWDFGIDIPASRNTFAALSEIYKCIENINAREVPLRKLIEEIANLFPGVEEAIRLKGAILGIRNKDTKKLILQDVKQTQLLAELLTSKLDEPFKSVNIGQYAKDLWYVNSEDVWKLATKLIDCALNPLGEEFLRGISEVVHAEDLFNVSDRFKILNIFLKLNPLLGASEDLWHRNLGKESELFDIISHSPYYDSPTERAVIRAMLNAGVNNIGRDVVRHCKDEGVMTVLDWLNESADQRSFWRYGKDLSQALEERPNVLLEWLQNSKKLQISSILLIVSLLDPHSNEVLNQGAKMWRNIAMIALNNSNDENLIKIMAFILAIGFNNPGEGSDELVAISFRIVHNAAAHNQLEYDSWKLLENQLPNLVWWRDWDRCERLRRALIDRFIRYNWNPEKLLNVVGTKDIFLKILDYCDKDNKCKSFFKNQIDDFIQGKINIPEEQK
jgi:hypothetical protein